MEISEIWSVSPRRIADFFLSIGGAPAQDEPRYSFAGCTVRLIPLPDRALGRLSLCQTQVCFSGEDVETERIHRAFFLHFLSAGG